MKAMQPASARALTGAATLVLFVGFLVPAPSGAFFAFGLSAILYAVPAILGSGKVRLIAAILLLCSVALAAGKYPDFKGEQDQYRLRTKATSSARQANTLG
jgi:hypothetical protein